MNRRKRRAVKKPIPLNTIWSLSLGAASGLLFAICIWVSYIGAGKIGNVTVAFATIGIMMSIAGTVMGYREFSDADYFSMTRILGLILPAVAAALWLVLYIFGIFVL